MTKSQRISKQGSLDAFLHYSELPAQCVGYIACAELPRMLWPDCINRLMMNVTDANATEMLKEASLEAIGYICQDIVSVYILSLLFGLLNLKHFFFFKNRILKYSKRKAIKS